MNWADIDKWVSNLQGKARITTMKSHGMLQGRVKRKGIIKASDRKHVPREADEADVAWDTEERRSLWLCLTKSVFVSSSCLNRHDSSFKILLSWQVVGVIKFYSILWYRGKAES